MSEKPEASIRVRVDPTNPGQFFACCGLLELADRLWEGAEGWFEGGGFLIHLIDDSTFGTSTLNELLSTVAGVDLRQVDPNDDYSSPIHLPPPFDFKLDWWKDTRSGGDRLKVWAGSMRSVRIARAMQSVLLEPSLQNEALFDSGMVVYDPLQKKKKVEPFYFDARRGASSRAIDIGFSPDSLQMTATAYPAVEFLCLVGLQRFRPLPTDRPRIFDYYTWTIPLAPLVAPSAACGLLTGVGDQIYRFENAFRTSQKKHKAFMPATRIRM